MTELAVRTKVLFGLGGVALAVLAWWLFGIVRKPASPEDVSRAAIAAFVEGDADKLYSLMSDDEKKAMKIEPADFAAFFTTIVRPRTASFTPVGEPAIKAQGFRYNQVFTVQEMRADDGRKFKLSFAAAPAGREDSLATHMIVTPFYGCA